MNHKNTATLFDRYPRLYQRLRLQSEEEHRMSPHGFECEDGWFGLIDQLSAQIESECQRLVSHENVPLANLPIAMQVKQKSSAACGITYRITPKPLKP